MADAKKQAVKDPAAEAPAEGIQKITPPGLIARSAPAGETRPEQKGCFGFKGGLIGFVDWEGEVFVTPGTRLKLDILQESGFNRPKPPIGVPFSDGTIKSKRWLRKALPKAEIMRSVEENLLPKMEPRVYNGLLKINLEGLKALPEEFLNQRCVLVQVKFYHYVGLCATYRGILSFTDWEADTWVTPYSPGKKALLEAHGYVYVESMIKVPYSLESKENRIWLARNIPAEEWKRTEKEVEQAHLEESLQIAKAKIEQLGLKDLPAELLAESAECEVEYPNYIGLAGSHNGILSFTDPLARTYVTPATQAKVELLKSLGYQFMGSGIKVPHSLKSKEDILWLKTHISEELWENARKTAEAELQRIDIEQAEKRQRSLGLEDLPSTLIDHSIKTDTRQLNFCGQYFVRHDILGFVDPVGVVYITPSTKKKIELLKAANYQPAVAGFILPCSEGTQADLDFIRRHLSQEELDESSRERAEESETELDSMIRKLIEKRKIAKLPAELLERSARTDIRQIDLIGHYCSRGGVTCFIHEDGYYFVTPHVPWKEEALKEAGYSLPEALIRVPYGSGTEEDQQWLESNLPQGELEKSREELRKIEKREKDQELKAHLKKIGLAEQVPQELASRSAKTPELNEDQIGHYLIQKDLIAFVGPDGSVWLTPYTPSKIKMLEKAVYKQATRKIVLPFSGESEEDVAWRNENLPEGEILRSREEIEALEHAKEDHLAADIAVRHHLKELGPEFLERCLVLEKVNPQLAGLYYLCDELLFFVDGKRVLQVTPQTPAKLKAIAEAGYHGQEKIPALPRASGSPEDLQWIAENLPEGEFERSRQESLGLERAKLDEKVLKNLEKFSLKPVEQDLLERFADSGESDSNNIGRLGIYRGVFAFVGPDERVLVGWYTPDKQEALEECGYKLAGRLPIKVPYAMPDPEQRRWLRENLPEPDEEEAISVEENAEGL